MKKNAIVLILFILSGCLSVAVLGSTDSSELIVGNYYLAIADKFYQTQELPGNLELALSYYKKALRTSHSLDNLEWKLARCYWTLAEQTGNRQKKALYYKRGIQFGNDAVKHQPNNSFAYTWLSLNTGSSALNEGIMKTLYKREVIKAGLQKAIELNPNNPVAVAGLASWYYHVPALFGGDQEKAFVLIDRAIGLNPHYMAPRMLKADFLIAAERYADALAALKTVVKISTPHNRWQGTRYRLKARELIIKLKMKTSS
jgi:tetratricopeptide (TPR) repeat protein